METFVLKIFLAETLCEELIQGELFGNLCVNNLPIICPKGTFIFLHIFKASSCFCYSKRCDSISSKIIKYAKFVKTIV